jgi:hypothetical protein
MAQTRITIGDRTYDSPEAMPPEVRAMYEKVMREVRSLEDRNGNGIPDILEDEGGPPSGGKVVVQNRIAVNGVTYRSIDDMPPDVRAVYEDVLTRVRRGSGMTVTREGPTISLELSRSSAPNPQAGAPDGRPIGSTSVESSVHLTLVVAVVLVIGALAVWALLGR